jgi:hypothetical protein
MFILSNFLLSKPRSSRSRKSGQPYDPSIRVTQPDPALMTTAPAVRAAQHNVPRSAASFLAIIAGLVVIKVLIANVWPAMFASAAQAKVFQWWFIGALAVLGLMGVWFAARTGFPETWDPTIPMRERVLYPAIAGVLLGLIAIEVDAATGWSAVIAHEMNLPSINIAFPASLIIYPGGAAIVDIVYYLVPIPLLMWLTSLALKGRWQTETFWVIGALCAAIEPVTQDLGMPRHPAMMAVMFAQDYALNLAQVWTFRRAGFGAAVWLRVVFYVAWHIIPSALGR